MNQMQFPILLRETGRITRLRTLSKSSYVNYILLLLKAGYLNDEDLEALSKVTNKNIVQRRAE